MTTNCGTPLTSSLSVLKDQIYTDRADLFAMGCIFYFLIKKQYPCEEAQTIEDIITIVENDRIPYSCPLGKREYKPFMDLAKFLLQMVDTKINPGERRDNEIFWKEFCNKPLAIECMKLADEKFK